MWSKGTRIMKVMTGAEDSGPFCFPLPIGARATFIGPIEPDSYPNTFPYVDGEAIPDGDIRLGGIQCRCWVEIPKDQEEMEHEVQADACV